MREPFSYTLLLVAIVSSALPVGAQLPELRHGTRVRIVASTLKQDQQLAEVISLDNDSLFFRSEVYPVTRALPVSDINSIEVSLGEKRHAGTGAIVGLLGGGTIGAIAGGASYTPCQGFACAAPHPRSHGSATVFGALVGGGLGAAAGALAGWAIKTEKWQHIELRTSVGAVPSRGGAGITVSHSF